MIYIELLAPARDLPTAIEAIQHGADAVYIGAERFGARAAAGNSVSDIAELCRQAHVYGVKVYVTVNTILKDEELADTEKLLWALYEAGVDAFIVQDMALLQMSLPPVPLHASTQMDNRTAEKVKWLRDVGFTQAVLARELSIKEIAHIHRQVPDMPLEVFVHGSICVSYNGQCYASQYCFGRSANRGECAQFCRLPFDLEDADGKILERQRHLLSLRDMNRSDDLERLLDAGVTSLKIEGRLKDVGYVKNVVSFYRQRLDRLFLRRKEYGRSSVGRQEWQFEPNLACSFNRGFTHYFMDGRTRDLCNPYSPKSMGEYVGTVKNISLRGRASIVVAGVKAFHNGDGLCYLDDENRLQGFRINRAEGNRLFPQQMPNGLRLHTPLYRNQNQEFEMQLARPSALRKVSVRWHLSEVADGFQLTAVAADNLYSYRETFLRQHEEARMPQTAQIMAQLERLGGTPYESVDVCISFSKNWFIPSSVLAEWRRKVIVGLTQVGANRRHTDAVRTRIVPLSSCEITYLGNVSNHKAKEFYLLSGAKRVDLTMEVDASSCGSSPLLMTCRYCLRYQLGQCHREGKSEWRDPLYLRLLDGRRFRLQFDCKLCQMRVYAE